MSIEEETVRLTASDGHQLSAHLARAGGEARGGLVILQEIFGVTDQLKSVARAYAAQGYDTIVPAFFDRVAPDTIVPFDDPPQGLGLMKQCDRANVMRDADAARAHVDGGNGVSVLGFCWGGGMALKAAGELELTGAVSFYGTALADFLGTPPKCPTLFHFGETDDYTPPELIDRVRQAIPEAEVYAYPAGHAFANDARASHVKEAADAAHARSLAFLNRLHG